MPKPRSRRLTTPRKSLQIVYTLACVNHRVFVALSIGAIGCSGAPFTFIGDTQIGDADVLPEASSETTTVDVGSAGDAGRMAGGRDAQQDIGSDYDGSMEAAEASQAADARGGDAAVNPQDAVDVGTVADAALESEAGAMTDAFTGCTSIVQGTFGCGPPILVERPGQYCIDQWGAPDASQPAVTAPMPAACQCAETYDCACLLAAVPQPCSYGKYQSCSTGTTGGVVVVCR